MILSLCSKQNNSLGTANSLIQLQTVCPLIHALLKSWFSTENRARTILSRKHTLTHEKEGNVSNFGFRKQKWLCRAWRTARYSLHIQTPILCCWCPGLPTSRRMSGRVPCVLMKFKCYSRPHELHLRVEFSPPRSIVVERGPSRTTTFCEPTRTATASG